MTEKEQDVSLPHGREQMIKMELMGMIHSAANPFDIIDRVAQYLEQVSAEAGYADEIRKNIRAVYGLALGEPKLIADEIREVEARLVRIRAAYEDASFTEEEKKRILYAIRLHEENIERLNVRLHAAEINGESLYMNRE